MFKNFDLSKLDEVMDIWIETNIDAHNFIPEEYWTENFQMVKEILPSAEVYIYEESNLIKGFVGVVEQNYIAGIFVRKAYQQEISLSHAKIIDISMKYGHDSPESFSKAFTRFHGITPNVARRSGAQLKSFNRLIIKDK